MMDQVEEEMSWLADVEKYLQSQGHPRQCGPFPYTIPVSLSSPLNHAL